MADPNNVLRHGRLAPPVKAEPLAARDGTEVEMNLLRKMWKGEFNLPKIFWIGLVLPIFVVTLLNLSGVYSLMLIQVLSSNFPLYLLFLVGVPILFLIYLFFVSVSAWRSASKSDLRTWRIISKGTLFLFWVVLVGSSTITIVKVMKRDTDDPGKNSHNINSFLKTDTGYPYIGFWKNNCSDDFGLSIDKAGNGFYSVSFCGPGRCFKPGTYRPHTKLIGDPAYKIIDDDRIEVKGQDGFTEYKRCK